MLPQQGGVLSLQGNAFQGPRKAKILRQEERVTELIQVQAERIQALKEEIALLRQKGGLLLPQIIYKRMKWKVPGCKFAVSSNPSMIQHTIQFCCLQQPYCFKVNVSESPKTKIQSCGFNDLPPVGYLRTDCNAQQLLILN